MKLIALDLVLLKDITSDLGFLNLIRTPPELFLSTSSPDLMLDKTDPVAVFTVLVP